MNFSVFTEPKYEGKSICNILPSFARLYSIQSKDKIKRVSLSSYIHNRLGTWLGTLIKKSKRIVIFEIDGLGFNRRELVILFI